MNRGKSKGGGSGYSGQCVLRSLENPTLNGILLGIDIKENDFAFGESMFPCCRGKGERYLECQQTTVRCELKARFQRTRQLMIQYCETWAESFPQYPHLMPARKSAGLIMDLSQVIKGNRPRGTLKKGAKGKPGDFFALALAASWRFGLDVKLVTFGKTRVEEQMPGAALNHSGRPVILLLEQVDGLWEPAVANQFEALVSWAYRSNAFLWVEFAAEEKKPGAVSLSSRSQFAQRIASLKTRSPFDFLDEGAISRLNNLCSLPRLP